MSISISSNVDIFVLKILLTKCCWYYFWGALCTFDYCNSLCCFARFNKFER